PIDNIKVVVSESTPLLLGSTLELSPVPFNSIPVHDGRPPDFRLICKCPNKLNSLSRGLFRAFKCLVTRLPLAAGLLAPIGNILLVPIRDLFSAVPSKRFIVVDRWGEPVR